MRLPLLWATFLLQIQGLAGYSTPYAPVSHSSCLARVVSSCQYSITHSSFFSSASCSSVGAQHYMNFALGSLNSERNRQLRSLAVGNTWADPLCLKAPASKSASRRFCVKMQGDAREALPVKGDIKTFLTQRSLQALIGLLNLGRDEITADWLEEWGGHEGIGRYHGLNGLKKPWDSYLNGLLRSEPEVIVVEFKRRGAGVGGWSGNNPYLKNHVYEYKTDINPRVLAERMIKVREQLMEEWVEVLPLLEKEEEQMWSSYFRRVRSKDGNDDEARLQFPILDLDPTHNTGSQNRGGDYDLLKALATVTAIDRIRKEAVQAGTAQGTATAEWIERMMNVHGHELEGDMQVGAADRLLMEMLRETPRIIPSSDGKLSAFVDPIGTIERILRSRSQIAKDWCSELAQVPSDHASIMRKLLEEAL